MKILLALLLMIPGTTLAENLKLKLSLSVDGQAITSPTIIASTRQPTSVVLDNKTSASTFVDILSIEKNDKHPLGPWYKIKLKIEKQQRNGQRVVISKPVFMVPPGKKASMKQYDSTGLETLAVTIKAQPML